MHVKWVGCSEPQEENIGECSDDYSDEELDLEEFSFIQKS